MEYKCILERNCEDAKRHLADAKRMGGEDRIAVAYQALKVVLDIAREKSPEIYAKYVQYL